jgi:hypothetical protein
MPGERAVDLAAGPRRYWGRRGPLFSARSSGLDATVGTIGRVTQRRRPRLHALGFTAFVLAAAFAACTGGANGTSGPGASTFPTDEPIGTVGTEPPEESAPSQSDTAWGRIWDSVPGWFPSHPDAKPATDAGEGASSALLTIPGAKVAEIADFYATALKESGYEVTKDNPLGDGSVVVSGSQGDTCQVQVTARLAGDSNLVTVLYGAGCDFE